MRNSILLLSLFGLTILLVAGCSPLHTEVKPGYRFKADSAVVLQAPVYDPWGLVPLMRQELQAMGYELVLPGYVSPDLIVRFSTQDGPDFTSEGVPITRPKSLHVQFVDPGTDALLAVADYFLRSSEEPAAGMKALLAGLHQRLRSGSASVPANPRKQAQTPARPVVAEGAQQSDAPTVAMPFADIGGAPAPSAESGRATTLPEEIPGGQVAPSITAEEIEPAIRPLERSPWVPRFKSWGFENWGKTDDNDR